MLCPVTEEKSLHANESSTSVQSDNNSLFHNDLSSSETDSSLSDSSSCANSSSSDDDQLNKKENEQINENDLSDHQHHFDSDDSVKTRITFLIQTKILNLIMNFLIQDRLRLKDVGKGNAQARGIATLQRQRGMQESVT